MELLAPAKINLCLHVVGRRADGYHELRSLMCCVALYDHIALKMGAPRDEIHCRHPGVPEDDSNLALKAAFRFNAALASETACTPLKVSIQLRKTIPVGAGLGGGSSDAAAVLKGLNRHYNHPFDQRRLQALALDLGADVPFFIFGRPAVVGGIGEQITAYEGLPALNVVLIFPGFSLSTAKVFENITLGLTKSEKKLRNIPFINESFSATRHLHNDLEAGVGDHFPVIAHMKAELHRQGAMGALMTGSGSAVFGLFENATGALKAKAAVDRHPGWRVFTTRLLTG